MSPPSVAAPPLRSSRFTRAEAEATVKLEFDHLVYAAPTLAGGVAAAQSQLGVEIPAGGRHDGIGTHNHLVRLGADEFLEVIAVDPAAAAPQQPRWFGLDLPVAAPRLATFVVRTDDLDAALRALGPAAGIARTASRQHLSWRIGVPDDGSLPFAGALPTVLAWPAGPPPGAAMAGRGLSLHRLVVSHPHAALIAARLAGLLDDPRIVFERGEVAIVATIATPEGLRTVA